MSKEIHVTVYTREGKKELTYKEWIAFSDSKLHREGDLPAAEFTNGTMRWYKYGMEHRETGPALYWYDGGPFYYLANKCYSEEDFNKKLKEVDELPLSLALTHEEEWIRERAKRREL